MAEEYEITHANVTTLEQVIDSVLANSPSGDDIKALIVRIKTAEDLIRTFHKTGDVVKRFCETQCRMLLRIVEDGYAQYLDEKDKKIARWISNMPKAKREELCEVCGKNGVSVSYYFNKAEKENKFSAKMDKLEEAASQLIDDYRSNGYVEATVQSIIKAADIRDCKENRNMARYAISSVPKKLVRLGAIGAGDGVYINPESQQAHEQSKHIVETMMVNLVETAGEISKLLWQLDVEISEIGDGDTDPASRFNKVRHLAIPMFETYHEMKVKE